MPEERGLYPKMHLAEQLAYLGELHGMTGEEAREAALRWLDRFGLADRRDADLQALSLGNQQRSSWPPRSSSDPSCSFSTSRSPGSIRLPSMS